MTDYAKVAEEFLARINATCEIECVENGLYSVTITTPLGAIDFELVHRDPSAYTALIALVKDDPGTYEDFCLDWTLDEDDILNESWYMDALQGYHQTKSIFTPEQIDLLREDAERWLDWEDFAFRQEEEYYDENLC